MKHVILEGPDGAGKTTLAQAICARFRMEYHHEGPPPREGALVDHYEKLLLHSATDTVFDRLYLGELVYGPLLRNHSRLSHADVHRLTMITLNGGIPIFVCLPPLETCLATNRYKNELIKDQDKLKRAYAAWQELVHKFCRPTLDYTLISKPHMMSIVMDELYRDEV